MGSGKTEANPNNTIFFLDLWPRSGRPNHGIFNVFQRPICSLTLWKWSKKDTQHPSHGVFEVFQVEVFFFTTSGLSVLWTTPLTPWAAYLRLSWGQTCKVDQMWLSSWMRSWFLLIIIHHDYHHYYPSKIFRKWTKTWCARSAFSLLWLPRTHRALTHSARWVRSTSD